MGQPNNRATLPGFDLISNPKVPKRFLVILTRFARVPGGFLIGSIFALDLLGVGHEQAVATATLVVVANMLTVSLIGALTLWRHGVTLADLRADKTYAAKPC